MLTIVFVLYTRAIALQSRTLQSGPLGSHTDNAMSKSAVPPVVLTFEAEGNMQVDESEPTAELTLSSTRKTVLSGTMACAGLLNVGLAEFGSTSPDKALMRSDFSGHIDIHRTINSHHASVHRSRIGYPN